MGFALSDMQLTSAAFSNGGAIPQRHTGEGRDVSPPLAWSAAPSQTKSFALFCHDPDAPLVKPARYGFVHWVLYGIAADATQLAEATDAGVAGVNDFGKHGYGGPMPPEGHGLHRYYFWLLALDDAPGLAPGLTLWQLLERVEANVIGMNRLVGTYERG